MRVAIGRAGWRTLAGETERRRFEHGVGDDATVVFSVGTFLRLIRESDALSLAPTIGSVTDEYLPPFQLDLEGEYRYSQDPMALGTVDAEWYERCRRLTRDDDAVATLQQLFTEADFDDGPVAAGVSEFRRTYEQFESVADGDDTTVLERKLLRTFPEYTTRRNGSVSVAVGEIPKKRFVVGMSAITVSQQHDDPRTDDYRAGIVWAQAVVTGCDVVWTTDEFALDAEISDTVFERLDREPPVSVDSLDELLEVADG